MVRAGKRRPALLKRVSGSARHPGRGEPLGHLLLEALERGQRTDEDGDVRHPTVAVELEEVDALELAVADPRLEAESHRSVLGMRLVRVGKVLEDGLDVDED